jgi:hypothetical protein
MEVTVLAIGSGYRNVSKEWPRPEMLESRQRELADLMFLAEVA